MNIFNAKRSVGTNHNLLFQAAILAILCAILLIGKQVSLALFGILIVAWILALIAYRFPYLTIVLVFLGGQLIGHEAQLLLPGNLREPDLGFMKLRYFDPILLGIVLAISLKVLHRNKLLFQFFFRDLYFWTIFFIWLSIEIMRSFGTYSIINTLGEFRTYYQYLFFVPYIVVFFETEDKQWRLFKLLIVLSSLFILSGIIRGWALHDLEIGFNSRWISASANLALLSGMIAVYLGVKNKVFKSNNNLSILLFVSALFLTVTNGHRSVWLAASIAFLLLILTRQMSFKSTVLSWIAGMAACLAIFFVFQIGGKDISQYFDNRMMAFTNYHYDDNASWRYALWMESLDKIYQNPVAGMGLGRHFQFHSFSEIITTSPHNLYITIAYHTGIVGLMLYVGLIVQVLLLFRKILKGSLSSQHRTMIMSAVVVLISSSAYYIAYPFEYFTWLYVGLGISVCITKQKVVRLGRYPAQRGATGRWQLGHRNKKDQKGKKI